MTCDLVAQKCHVGGTRDSAIPVAAQQILIQVLLLRPNKNLAGYCLAIRVVKSNVDSPYSCARSKHSVTYVTCFTCSVPVCQYDCKWNGLTNSGESATLN